MNQPPVNQFAPPSKKSNKALIIVVVFFVALCGCCVLVVGGGAGYYYINPDAAQNILPPEILNSIQGGASPSSPDANPKEVSPSSPDTNPNGGSQSTNQSTYKVLEEMKKMGAASFPLKVTAPDGMKVVEQVAIVAVSKDNPTLCDLYVGMILENSTATMKLNMDYKLWTFDTSQGGEERLRETGTGKPMWATIPVHQTGILIWENKGFLIVNFPSRLEINLKPVDSSQPLDKGTQKSMDKLNDNSLPNPYFTAVSSEIVANQQSSGTLFDIEANGKYINNLPVDNFAHGFFLFYDNNGKIVGFSDSIWSKKQSGLIPPKGEGELNGPLPYSLAVKPVKVVFYPYISIDDVINLQHIK